MEDVLCVRELRNDTDDSKETVKVAIGKPERKSENEFVCPFQVTGLETSETQYAYGVDCFQALIMALEGIRTKLEKSGMSLTWIGGQTGEHGFPRFVPSFYGPDFSRHVNELIEGEILRFAARVQKKS